jgi:hypothetical protein
MRRSWRYLLLGTVAYLVALAATFPAGRALQLAAPALAAANIRPAGVEGSIWSGRAASVLVDGRFPLEAVRWELDLLPLLAARLAGDWRAGIGTGGLQGGVSAAGEQVTLSRMEGQLPIGAVAPLLPLPLPVAGDLTVNLVSLSLVAGRPAAAEGTIVWSRAAVTAPQAVALGDLRITLTPREGGGISGRLSDGGGPLDLSGELTVEPGGAYRLSASVGTRPDAAPALVQALPLLGRKGPGGKYLITYNGRI